MMKNCANISAKMVTAEWLNSDAPEPLTLWQSHPLSLLGTEIVLPSYYQMSSDYLSLPSNQPTVSLYRLHDICVSWRCDILRAGQPLQVGNILPRYTAQLTEANLHANKTEIISEAQSAFLFCHNTVYTYGHFMLEMAPKLLVYNILQRSLPDLPLVVSETSPNHVKEWIKLLAPNAKVLSIPYGGEIRLNNAFCSDSLLTWHLAGNAFGAFIEQCLMAAKDVPAGQDHLYISRRSRRSSASDFRTLVNAQEIEDMMLQAGFRIVEPETIPLAEQISLFTNARVVVGELCSALHNTVFSPAGTHVVQLNPFNLVQRRLALTLGHSLVSLIPDDGILRDWPGYQDKREYTVSPTRVLEAALNRP